MIIIKLKGGLGNQLFQYAAGRALSLRSGLPLKLDVSGYQSDALRNYRLRFYGIVEDFATETEINRLNPPKHEFLAWSRLHIGKRFKPFHRASYIRERWFPFDPEILKISQPAYLNGYWQSERYFSDITDVLVREFTPTPVPRADNEALAQRMRSSASVSLHIRRGDYVSNPEAQRVHGSLSLDHYRRAVDLMAGRVAGPHFFIFSDDIGWAAENLDLAYPATFVGATGGNADYEDLWLMSQCRHQIIANSSFSWWGAWLNRNPDKIVIAPQRWFAASIDTRDLIPSGWLRI